jgi:hypothetical protein
VIQVTTLSAPQFGSLFDLGGGNYVYTPAPGFVGTDRFTYQVTDSHGASDTVTVFVAVSDNTGGPGTGGPGPGGGTGGTGSGRHRWFRRRPLGRRLRRLGRGHRHLAASRFRRRGR